MKKTVLITGAASGMGRAATEEFASHGYQVFATYRSDGQRAELEAIRNVFPIYLDVTDVEQIKQAVATVTAEVGDDGLYAVINNAGTTYAAPFEYAVEKRAREVMDVNVMAPYLITQAFIPLLVAHNKHNAVKARVVNIASWAGFMASPFIPFYNASKFAIIGLTESMYYDLGLLDIHTVLGIPGITKTPLLAKTTGDAAASLESLPEEGRKRYRELFEHYATLGDSSSNMPGLSTADGVAKKLYKIVERTRPRFRNYLGNDAALIDNVVTRLPRVAQVTLTNRMYRLNSRPKAA